MNKRIFQLLVLLWATCLGTLALAAELTANLDRDSIVEGETVTLVVQTDDPKQSLDTSLDRLENDFHVIDQRSETQMSIVNGRQSAVVRLLLTLEPKRTGRLMIPSLEFRGGLKTAPQVLTVDPAPELAPGEQPPVFIEVEVDPREGPYYVHAQLSLKVRIFYQQNLTEAAINPPAPPQASVRLLDEVPYQADRNGVRYRVLERRYAIFPERSGDMAIPPLQLTGRLIERPADRLWQPSVRGRRVRIESDPMSLEIRPRPAQFSGDVWLPAREVELAQQITDGEEVRVGEPVTRTVMLDATGLEEHMLEEPVWPEVTNARIYPDQPQGISRDDGQWVLGHREFRYAVVPEVAGELVLPELRLAWWDTVNDRERIAILPEHRVSVLPSALEVPAPVAPVGGDSVNTESSLGESFGIGGYEVSKAGFWQAVSLLLLLLWVGTMIMYLRRQPAAPRSANGAKPEPSGKDLLDEIQKAARANDARSVHLALGRWVRRFGPSRAGGSLMGLASAAGSSELTAAIRELDALAYGGAATGSWNGTDFWKLFQGWLKSENSRQGTSEADPLDLYAKRSTA